MKKYVTFSLFIFTAIVAGVLFVHLFDKNKTNQMITSNISTQSGISITGVDSDIKTITLFDSELKKHNSYNSCWLLISGKVYDVTSYLNSHPGGEAEILKTCGTDATVIYDNRDNTGSHSSKARSILANYYIGDFGQKIILKPSASPTNQTTKTNQNYSNNNEAEED